MQDSSLLIFLLTSLLIILSPGQDMVLVLSRSIARGTQAGVITAAGVATGLLGHTLLVAAGLGAVLQASELAFNLMKYLGAAYLLYLGVKAFRAPPMALCCTGKAQDSMASFFLQGAISNICNPKIAVFYFAYLPQFVSVDSTHPATALLALGATFALLTFLVKMPIGLVAGALSGWVQSRPAVQRWINRSCGGVMITMASRLMVDEQASN